MASEVEYFGDTKDFPDALHFDPKTDNDCKGRAMTCQLYHQNDVFRILALPQPSEAVLPCLPVSKGYIKKTAQTRFVNSSPKSYRLMPASAEASDKTSFVEKCSYNNYLPVKFMLEVAEFWEVSKRSELDCNFTLAKSEIFLGSEYYMKEAKQRSPICHSEVLPSRACQTKYDTDKKMDIDYEIAKARLGKDLFSQVTQFLRAQKLGDKYPMGIAGLTKTEFHSSESSQCGAVTEKSPCLCHGGLSNEDYLKADANGSSPLAKQLYVAGLEEATDFKVRTGRSRIGMLSKHARFVKLPACTKRHKCGRLTGHDGEPHQKRAYCSQVKPPMNFHL